MSVTVGRSVTFEAVVRHGERLLGHRYCVTFLFDTADPDPFEPFAEWVANTFDGACLSDVVPVEATAPNLARWLHGRWRHRFNDDLVAVRVEEAPDRFATYQETGPRHAMTRPAQESTP